MIIKIKDKKATDYQYQAYKNDWILEVINDYDEYYTARVISGSKRKRDSVIAVHKGDCKQIELGEHI